MFTRTRRLALTCIALAAGLTAGEAVAQTPADPPPGRPLRSLGREFLEGLAYPFVAIPEGLRNPAPSRVALRPAYGAGSTLATVPPAPVKPLYISGYAGSPPPAPRLRYIPANRSQPISSHRGSGHHHGSR